MDNIRNRILDLSYKFQEKHGYAPNELFVGFKEVDEIDIFVLNSWESYHKIQVVKRDNIYKDKHRERREFMGLKMRYVESNSYLDVAYNPHY